MGADKREAHTTEEDRMDKLQMTTEQLQGLIDSQIVNLQSAYGEMVDGSDAATTAQMLSGDIYVHAMSGRILDLWYDASSNTFSMEVIE